MRSISILILILFITACSISTPDALCNDAVDKKEYESAIELCTKAISINKFDKSSYNERGIAYENLNMHEQALNDYDSAIDLDPAFHIALYNRCGLLRDLGQYNRSLADCDNASYYKPDFADIYALRAAVKFDMGNKDGAIKDMNTALKLEPGNENFLAEYLIINESELGTELPHNEKEPEREPYDFPYIAR